MLVLVPILIVISLWLGININIAWVKHLFGLSARSFMLLLILIEHLFVFSLSCLISSLIFGFKTQRKGRLYGAIFGGIFSVFMPTVPLILGMDGFIYRFAVGGVWYVWVMIILCSLSMVTCGALGGSLGERLAQRRIPKVA
jgi:LytS/YehU family sensor histidine kinase